MKGLVVYESMFGNTQLIAKAVLKGLSSQMTVDMVEVGVAPTVLGEDVALLVIGGPTHAFGLSRRGTRQSAADQSEHGLISAGIGLREWLDVLEAPSAPIAAASFDTRINKPRLPGSAASGGAKRLNRLGFRLVASPESFYVMGTPGPLVEGELGRAQRWAAETVASELRSNESPNVRSRI